MLIYSPIYPADMSHRRDAPKAHLHTTIKPEILEIVEASAPKRAWNRWIEDAILEYAGKNGDLRALNMKESALLSKRKAIKEQIAALHAELGLIESELAGIRAIKEQIGTIDPNQFYEQIEALAHEDKIKEWLHDINTNLAYTKHELIEEISGVEFRRSYREYKITPELIEKFLKRILRMYEYRIEKIREDARRKLVLISEADIEQRLRERIKAIVEAEIEDMNTRAINGARRIMERQAELHFKEMAKMVEP